MPRANRDSRASHLEIVATSPATDSIASEIVFPLHPGEAAYTSLSDGIERGASIIIRREETAAHGATVAVSEGEQRVEFLKRESDGSAALTAAIDRHENALTLFNPPLVVCPATLTPNQPFSSESAMRIVALDNPGKQRETGRARRTITLIGDATMRTARGDEQVALIEIRFQANLRFADADERVTLYVSRADGLIAQKSIERVTILGMIPRETKRAMLREQ